MIKVDAERTERVERQGRGAGNDLTGQIRGSIGIVAVVDKDVMQTGQQPSHCIRAHATQALTHETVVAVASANATFYFI